MKSCTKCGETKALDSFHASAKARDGRASWCKTCANGIARVYRKRNYSTEQKRRYALKSRYNITPSEFNEMLNGQNGVCAICKKQMKRVCVDHDHVTGDVRGLLCHPCNIRLGVFDRQEWRDAALDYLKVKR